MSDITDIVLADGDGWKGLYKNGLLYVEGHTIDLEDFVDAVSGQPFTFKRREVNWDWLVEEGSLPKHIADVKWLTP